MFLIYFRVPDFPVVLAESASCNNLLGFRSFLCRWLHTAALHRQYKAYKRSVTFLHTENNTQRHKSGHVYSGCFDTFRTLHMYLGTDRLVLRMGPAEKIAGT